MPWKLLTVFLAAVSAHAQTFEVASVKPSTSQSQRGEEGGPGSRDPGRWTYNRADLSDLIATAWHVDDFQIVCKTPLDQQHFDITARVPEGATRQQFRVMLQNLLAERFHLKQHVETRDFSGFELIAAKSGPKLNAPAAGPEFPEVPPGRPGFVSWHRSSGGHAVVRLRAQQEPMSVLVDWLSGPAQRPVVDATGLAGRFDFTLEFAQDLPQSGAAAEPADLPNLFSALQQQLGLQLVPKKIPFPVVVVESVDKKPTEN